MSSDDPRLRGQASRRTGPYPLGQLPDRLLYGVAEQLVHRTAVGHADITGDDFGTIFAAALGGEHRGSPLGIADVVLNGCAWSVKTVKTARPFAAERVRLISGRCSPDYSLGVENPRANPEHTGRAVLSIWNARVNEALDEYNDLRIVVLIRSMASREYRLFEEEAQRFPAGDFRWAFNTRTDTLWGHDRTTDEHRFVWQPHGSQFTILRQVPASARGFSINRNVPMVTASNILDAIGFSQDWVTLRNEPG